MKNVWISVELQTKDIQTETISYEVEGTFDEDTNTLQFVEIHDNEDVESSTSTFYMESNGLRMIRENDEMHMDSLFSLDEQADGTYLIKEFDVKFPISIFTDELQVDWIGGFIHVRYYLEMNFENQGLFELTIHFRDL